MNKKKTLLKTFKRREKNDDILAFYSFYWELLLYVCVIIDSDLNDMTELATNKRSME